MPGRRSSRGGAEDPGIRRSSRGSGGEEPGMALQFLDLTRITANSSSELAQPKPNEDGPTPDVAAVASTSAENGPSQLPNSRITTPTMQQTPPTFVYTWKYKKTFIGCACVVVTSITWVSMTQFAWRTYTTDFQAPFFVIYFSTAWLLLYLPVYLLCKALNGRKRLSLKETLRKCLELPGQPEKVHPGSVLWRCVVFTFLWNASAYMFMRAVQIISPLHLLIVFVTHHGFIYLLSWIILHDRFMGIRIIGVILSLTGMSLITYRDGLRSQLMWGCLLALFAGVAAAAYKVLFSRLLGNVSCGKIAAFYTMLGAWNTLTMWPLFLLLYFTGVEPLVWSTVPWPWICAAAACMLVFTSVVLYGELVTYAVLVRTGFIIAIPFCAGADILLNGLHVDAVTLVAAGVAALSFVLLQLPDQCQESVLKTLRARRERPPPPRRQSISTSRSQSRTLT